MGRKSLRAPIAMSNQNKSWGAAVIKSAKKEIATYDSFANVELGLGLGGGNALSSGYFVNTVTQNLNWVKLRAMYSSNWLSRRLIEMQAEDMTREGIQVTGAIEPDDMKELYAEWDRLRIQRSLFETISMARLFGGAIAYIDILGADPETELDLSKIRKGQLVGLRVYDRWRLNPSIGECSPEDNLPMYYTVLSQYDCDLNFNTFDDVRNLSKYNSSLRIHRSRVIRCDGDYLPYWDLVQNNLWYSSVLINAMDVLTNYATASAALASAAYKSSFRVVKIERMFEVLNQGTDGQALQNLVNFVKTMKRTESVENVTILDREDSIEILNYDLNGLMMSLDQFERQVSSLSGAPATKLLGETSKGLNATGDNETRMYYDKIKSEQEIMRPDILNLLDVVYVSTFGKEPPDDLNFNFTPLWQMDPDEKAGIAKQVTDSVNAAYESGLVTKETALKELLQSSEDTDVWTNISEEDIDKAKQEEEEPPVPVIESDSGSDNLGDFGEKATEEGQEGGEEESEGVIAPDSDEDDDGVEKESD